MGRMKLSEIGSNVGRGSGVVFEGVGLIVKSRENLVGLMRKMCMECGVCKDEEKLNWEVVIRERKRNDGSLIDLWGLECSMKLNRDGSRGVRVIS